MIFVPSYFDFVRVRKHLKALELSFAVLSEYSSNQDISRARQSFFAGDKAFLVMTERFHFFRRYVCYLKSESSDCVLMSGNLQIQDSWCP